MSPDQNDVRPTAHSAGNRKWPAMRGGWSGWRTWTEEEQAHIDIKECTDARCMSVEVNCGYQGLDPDSFLSQSAAVGPDLRAAWKAQLKTEGKPSSGKSLRETLLEQSESAQ
ncbi:MAG TPA: hypothetical protein VGJ13_17965 [Pseudonocardiaceae bacterium]|jgi:hypothetical protein